MGVTNDLQREGESTGERKAPATSVWQLQLAESVVHRVIESNAGRAAADAFFDDDSFEFADEGDFDPDLEFQDLEETVPEMDVIKHNIFECD